jgi:hypothetical protein
MTTSRDGTPDRVSLELIGLRRRFGPVVALDGLIGERCNP